MLSASRSGFLGLVFLALVAIWRTKNRGAYLVMGILVGLIGLSLMSDLQRERYVSIFSHKRQGRRDR